MHAARLVGLMTGLLMTFSALAAPALPVEHFPIKRSISLPPSADLHYAITAQYGLMALKGEAQVRWTHHRNAFSIQAETTTDALGILLESSSEGAINAYGLAPTNLIEKRFRKPPYTVTFDHPGKTIRFSTSDETYPIKGGEQNRTSIVWQLVGITRGAPQQVRPGKEWAFFVAGRKNAENWTFRVNGTDTITTPLGSVSAIRITKLPSASREGQELELWLAPSLDWYPVRIVFKDAKGIDLDQVLQRIVKR